MTDLIILKIKIKKTSTDVSKNKIKPIIKVTIKIAPAPKPEKSRLKFASIRFPYSPELNIPKREIKINIKPIIIFGLINLSFFVLKKSPAISKTIKGKKMANPENFAIITALIWPKILPFSSVENVFKKDSNKTIAARTKRKPTILKMVLLLILNLKKGSLINFFLRDIIIHSRGINDGFQAFLSASGNSCKLILPCSSI